MPYRTKEQERLRGARRRLTQHYKEYQRKYQLRWKDKNKNKWKSIRNKSESRPERKEYQRNWQKKSPRFKEIKKRFKDSGRPIEWEHERKQNDLAFLITKHTRSRIKDALRKYLKEGKIDNISSSGKYGIDFKGIIFHLIKLLPLNFDYKKYEIDHIVACCFFDLTKPEEIKKCFAPENHQWLTKEEHRTKTNNDIKKFVEIRKKLTL